MAGKGVEKWPPSADVGDSDLTSDQRFRLDLAEKRYRLARIVVLCLTTGATVWFIADAFKAVAARITSFDVVVNYFTGSPGGWTVSVSLGFGLSGLAVAALVRHLCSIKTREMGSRIRYLERLINPGRTSSGLTPEGHTSPRDK